MVDPYKEADGSWNVRMVDSEMEVLHEDREYSICAVCEWPGYPECMDDCHNAKISKEQGLYNTYK